MLHAARSVTWTLALVACELVSQVSMPLASRVEKLDVGGKVGRGRILRGAARVVRAGTRVA